MEEKKEKIQLLTYKKYIQLVLDKMNLVREVPTPEHHNQRRNFEQRIPVQITSPVSDKDYYAVSDEIQTETPNETPVNINTLKKMYGKLKVYPDYTPNDANLRKIARYFHFDNWEDFTAHYDQIRRDIENSKPQIRRTGPVQNIDNYVRRLNVGDHIRIYYEPDRMLEAECIGTCRFRVVKQKNISSLSKDDTFEAYNFFIGSHLHFSQWTHNGVRMFGGFSAQPTHHITRIEIDEVNRDFKPRV